MKCPIDQIDLVIAERQGVEIDYCPKCRGVWLDRGELDKIIVRSAEFMADDDDEPAGGLRDKARHEDMREDGDDRWRDSEQVTRDERRKRQATRRSFLEELFDFD